MNNSKYPSIENINRGEKFTLNSPVTPEIFNILVETLTKLKEEK